MSSSIAAYMEQRSTAHVVLLTPSEPSLTSRIEQLKTIDATAWSMIDLPRAMENAAGIEADLVVMAPPDPRSVLPLVRLFRDGWRKRLIPLLVLCPSGHEQITAEAYAAGADFVATPQTSWSVLHARVMGILRLRSLVTLLVDSRDRAKSRLEQHERWSRFLVHDMRNPLMALKSGIGWLREAATLSDEDLTFCDQLNHELTRLTCLVNDLLDHERLVTGALKPERASVHLGELLEKIARANDSVATGRGVTLRLTQSPGDPVVHADGKLIERVLDNIMSNALRHSPSGKVVDLELTPGEKAVSVAILNSGPRVPPELRDSIFEPYVQVAGNGPTGASGLGLAFCREVTRAHRGSVRVLERDERTCFVLELPRR